MSARRCAKWCGRGCTQAEYEAARDAGRALAKSMGRGWRVRVWESLGWHYSVVSRSGMWKVHCNNGNSFSAIFGPGPYGGLFAENARTPRAAMRKVVRLAEQHIADALNMRDALKEAQP